MKAAAEHQDFYSRQLEAFRDISSATASNMDLVAVMQKILWSLTWLFRARACLLFLMDESDKLQLDSYCGYADFIPDSPPLEPDDGVAGILNDGRPGIVGCGEPSGVFSPIADAEGCWAILLPLYIRNGPLGLLVVVSSERRQLEAYDDTVMVALAAQVTIAIENNQLYDNMERRINELTTLVRIVASIASTLDLKFVLDTIVELSAHVMNGVLCSIRLIDSKTGRLKILSSLGLPEGMLRKYEYGEIGSGLSGAVVLEKRPIIVPEVRDDRRFTALDVAEACDLRSYLGVPLISRGKVIGVLGIYSNYKRRFSETEVRLFWSFADQAAIAVNNARLFDQVQNYSRQLKLVMNEVHHRVKNNLQAVADLLSLERLQSPDSTCREQLGDSINRVKSIAVVHDLLSHKDVERTDIKGISRRIMDIAGDMLDPGKSVDFVVEGDAIYLRSKQATSLALVLNELLVNSVKHAFADRSQGRVDVRLEEREKRIRVTVSDDGRGLPEDFDIKQHSHLGLQIVSNLVERDLHGRLEYGNDGGAVWSFDFLKDEKEEEDGFNANEIESSHC